MSDNKPLRAARKARVDVKNCAACGCCASACPRKAISIIRGLFAAVDNELCVGCGKCAKACPAGYMRLEAAQ